uniref:Structural maintenance of chromosomes 6 n=1 Tax=Nothobranchius kadleci TaxID=1051664 RepID=A0A1A8BN31_NOTKA
MKTYYIHIKNTERITRQQVEKQEESLKDLRQEFLQKKERYENLSSLSELKEILENLKKKMAWSLVQVKEKKQSKRQLMEEIEKDENDNKHQEKLSLCQTTILQVENKLQLLKKRTEGLKEEGGSLTEDSLRLKQQAKSINKAAKEQELVYFGALTKLRQSEQEQSLLQQKINKAETSGNTAETKHGKPQVALCDLKQ